MQSMRDLPQPDKTVVSGYRKNWDHMLDYDHILFVTFLI